MPKLDGGSSGWHNGLDPRLAYLEFIHVIRPISFIHIHACMNSVFVILTPYYFHTVWRYLHGRMFEPHIFGGGCIFIFWPQVKFRSPVKLAYGEYYCVNKVPLGRHIQRPLHFFPTLTGNDQIMTAAPNRTCTYSNKQGNKRISSNLIWL